MTFLKSYKTITGAVIMLSSISNVALGETQLETDIEAGLGFDSNPYHTPDRSYIDYAQTGNPLVTPDSKSGFYIPILADIKMLDHKDSNSFDKRYTLNMSKYLGADLENADEYSHRLLFGKNVYDDKTYMEIELGLHRKTYFDRDDGLLKTTSGGADISDRYNYINYGLNIEHDGKLAGHGYTVYTELEKRNYDDPVATTQLDHTRFTVGANSKYKLNKQQKLKYGYEYSSRNYSYRHARDVNAVLTAELLEYEFHDFSLTLISNHSEAFKTFIDFDYKIRNDEIFGYNDSITNKVKVRGIYYSGEVKTRLALTYYNTDYKNAFNYEDLLQGDKSTKSLKADFGVDFKYMGQNIWTSIIFTNKDTTDLRYKYDRVEASVGVSYTI